MRLLVLLIGCCFCTINIIHGQGIFEKHINQKDSEGKRQGLWVSYWDDEEEVPMSKAWFKNDKEYKSKEYHINGKIRLKMKWKEMEIIKVKYYDTLGNIDQKGYARFEFNPEDIHFYYEGWWKFYNPKHKVVTKRLFHQGEIIKEISIE